MNTAFATTNTAAAKTLLKLKNKLLFVDKIKKKKKPIKLISLLF